MDIDQDFEIIDFEVNYIESFIPKNNYINELELELNKDKLELNKDKLNEDNLNKLDQNNLNNLNNLNQDNLELENKDKLENKLELELNELENQLNKLSDLELSELENRIENIEINIKLDDIDFDIEKNVSIIIDDIIKKYNSLFD